MSEVVTEQKTEVWLPASTKAKLMRQVLVQKERGSIQVPCDLGEWWTPISKTNSLHSKDHLFFLLKPEVLTRIGKGRIFFYPIILLAFGVLGSCLFIFLAFSRFRPYPFIFLAIGPLCVRTFPNAILANGGDSLVLH